MLDDDALLGVLAVCLKKKESETKVKAKKKLWTRELPKSRTEFTYEDLEDELSNASPYDFRHFLVENDGAIYEELLDALGPYIKKKNTHMREAIPASQRFAATIRFLATGNDFQNIKDTCDISQVAVSLCVLKTCEAIITCLQDYMKVPETSAEWEDVARDFDTKWNFPNCLGAFNIIHIPIRKPPGSGSLYYSRSNKLFSVLLTALVDANYEILGVDIGIKGRPSDNTAFEFTSFGEALKNEQINIPDPRKLPFGTQIGPYVYVGSDGMQPTKDIMTPYVESQLSYQEEIYNYRLRRASQVAENALGVLATRFKVFQHQMRLAPEKVQLILKACCYLYNYLSSKTSGKFVNELADKDDFNTGSIIGGIWRDVTKLNSLQVAELKRKDEAIEDIRDIYSHYFDTDGLLAWQEPEIDII